LGVNIIVGLGCLINSVFMGKIGVRGPW